MLPVFSCGNYLPSAVGISVLGLSTGTVAAPSVGDVTTDSVFDRTSSVVSNVVLSTV